jgi:hypothetical protein
MVSISMRDDSSLNKASVGLSQFCGHVLPRWCQPCAKTPPDSPRTVSAISLFVLGGAFLKRVPAHEGRWVKAHVGGQEVSYLLCPEVCPLTRRLRTPNPLSAMIAARYSAGESPEVGSFCRSTGSGGFIASGIRNPQVARSISTHELFTILRIQTGKRIINKYSLMC